GQTVRRAVLLEHPLRVFQRCILASLTLGDDGVVAAECDDRLDVDPSAVECGRHASILFRCSAELPDLRLEFRRELRPLQRALIEEPAELPMFHMFGCRQKSVFTIAARLDQVLETLNEFLTINSHYYPHHHF